MVTKKGWRWADDALISSDKVTHLAGCGFLFSGFVMAGVGFLWSFIWTMILGILWEIKDAYVPWEEHGEWGGDGFSLKDLIADAMGPILLILISKIF